MEKNSSSALDLVQIRGIALFVFIIRKVKRVKLRFGKYYVCKNFKKNISNRGKKSQTMCHDYKKILTTLIRFDSLSTDVKVLDFASGTQAN